MPPGKKRVPPKLQVPGKFDPHARRLLWYVIISMAVLWGWQALVEQMSVKTIPYSEFKKLVVAHEVTQAQIKPDEIDGEVTPPAPKPAKPGAAAPAAPAPYLFRTVRVDDPNLVSQLQAAGTQYTGTRPNALAQFLFAWVVPLALMAGIWIYIGRKFGAAREGILGIGKSRARMIVDENTGVTFADVAGCDEAKQDLEEVVDFLKNPKRYQALGARIPKGALLLGPPGTGKTLLARAVAGQAHVPFFSISGSDFVEMFVGVGAARVRDLFKQAKQQAPCIIFIDELDAIGRQRGVHIGNVNDEREQTLNAMLVEMDGFEANAGVVILAATNRPEVLDRALLRPGRFDRQIVVDMPDLAGREAILRVHAVGKKLAAEVDLRRVAQATAGFSGADLANLLNEAALLAARHEEAFITQPDLEEAIERVIAGPERKTRRLNADEKRRVAFHEAGHAIVNARSAHGDTVHRISVVPRGRAALGYTMQLPTEEQFLMTGSEIVDRIRALLGGRAAEAVVFGEVSTGAQNDLERATALARQMVAIYGMSDRVGLEHCIQRPPAFLAGNDAPLQRDCSEQTAREIDEEVKRILGEAYDAAQDLLRTYRSDLDRVAAELLAKESLDGPEFYRLIGLEPPKPKAQSPEAAPPPVLPPRG